MALAGASNFIRVYRQQRETIDREYQDPFVVMTREKKLSSSEIRQWYARYAEGSARARDSGRDDPHRNGQPPRRARCPGVYRVTRERFTSRMRVLAAVR